MKTVITVSVKTSTKNETSTLNQTKFTNKPKK